MKRQFEKSKAAAQQLVAAARQKLLLTAQATGTKDGLTQQSGKRTYAEATSGIRAAFNTLIIDAYETMYGFTTHTLQQVQGQIRNLEAEKEDVERHRDIIAADLSGSRTLTGVLLRVGIFCILALFISGADAVILSGALQVFTVNLLYGIILASGICISLLLLPILSSIIAQRSASVKMRRLIEWGGFMFAVLIFALLIYARLAFDAKTGNEQKGETYLAFFCFNLLGYGIQHLLTKILLLPVINDIGPAWRCFLEKRKIAKLNRRIRHVEKQIQAKAEEESLLARAEVEALILEEKIHRLYEECLCAYRQAYYMARKQDAPEWDETAPGLDFIFKGKEPLTAQATNTDRFARKPIGFTAGAILLIGLHSCSMSEPKPTRFIGVVQDLTRYDTVTFNGQSLASLAGLTEEPDRGAEVRISTVTAKQFSPRHRLRLESTSTLQSNTTLRPHIIASFTGQIDSVLGLIQPAHKDLTENSLIFHAVFKMVNEFIACDRCSDGTILLRSDMLEHSPAFSIYTDAEKLKQNPSQVIDTLQKIYPIPTITKPLTIIIDHNPPLEEEEYFGLMLDLLKGYFARSPTVSVMHSP